MTQPTTTARLDIADLDLQGEVSGSGLLLPAVQSARAQSSQGQTTYLTYTLKKV